MIYRCQYRKDVHRNMCKALRIVRLTPSLYTTMIARIRRYSRLSTIFKCKDVQHTTSACFKCKDVQHTISVYIKCTFEWLGILFEVLHASYIFSQCQGFTQNGDKEDTGFKELGGVVTLQQLSVSII